MFKIFKCENINKKSWLWLILSLTIISAYLISICSITSIEAVVVDGKRKGPSALSNQSHEDELIDGYNTKDCGISDPDTHMTGFVNQAREGQFPWLVSFQIKDKAKPSHFCMGSFISDRWVLSAAHCFAPKSVKTFLDQDRIRLVAGTTDAYSSQNAQLTIKRIFYHSLFDTKNPIGFDVALIELGEKVKFKKSYIDNGELPFMNAVCLAKQGKEFSEGQAVKIAGWGDTESKDPNSKPDKLLTTDLLITNQAECAKIFSKKMQKVEKQYANFKDFICASYQGRRDACQGDSGGSMLEFADGKAVAVGIVSYGLGCATPGVPGVYERVSSLIPWIKDITMNKDKASVYYTMLERGKDSVKKNKTDGESQEDESKNQGVAKSESGASASASGGGGDGEKKKNKEGGEKKERRKRGRRRRRRMTEQKLNLS